MTSRLGSALYGAACSHQCLGTWSCNLTPRNALHDNLGISVVEMLYTLSHFESYVHVRCEHYYRSRPWRTPNDVRDNNSPRKSPHTITRIHHEQSERCALHPVIEIPRETRARNRRKRGLLAGPVLASPQGHPESYSVVVLSPVSAPDAEDFKNL